MEEDIKQIVPSEEEMNAMGKQIYESDEIHKQIVLCVNYLTKFFPLYIAVSSPTGIDGRTSMKFHQSVYLASDVQPIYETKYSKIAELKGIAVKVFPLSHLTNNKDNYETTQVLIQDVVYKNLLVLNNPESFSFVFQFLSKPFATIVHNVGMVSHETDSIKRSLDCINRMFGDEFKRAVKNFEVSKKYSGMASDANSSTSSGGDASASDSTPVAAPSTSQSTEDDGSSGLSSLTSNIGTDFSASYGGGGRLPQVMSRPGAHNDDLFA